MKSLPRRFYTAYINLLNSLAFYPSLIAIAFLLFSFVVMSMEYQPWSITLKKAISVVLVDGVENARLVLGTISGSIFSLMVFSFSMVMLVLNRATATLSPRVVPGLVSKKSHQVVLGVYIGTIIYSLILIVNIQSKEAEYRIPSIGILIDMIFGILCLGLFVYFIDSISKSIQVDNILDRIFKQTSHQMEYIDQDDESQKPLDVHAWHSIVASEDGYLKQIKSKALIKICVEYDLIIALTEEIGFFIVKGYPILKINREVNEKVRQEIRECLIFYIAERVTDHYVFGFKQISEIAVKALSPGINDPGTAVKAMDMLTILFIKKMHIKERNHIADSDGHVRVHFAQPSMESLMFWNITPLREYGKSDATVMLKLLDSLKNMAFADKDKKQYQELLCKYIESMVNSCNRNITNDLDLEQLDHMVKRINDLLGDDYNAKRILEPKEQRI